MSKADSSLPQIPSLIEPPPYLQDRGSDAPAAFAWWYRLAAPPAVSPQASYEARVRLRQGRLASIILLLELIVLVLVFFALALPSQKLSFLLTDIVAILALIIGIVANRRGLSTFASWIVVLSVDAAMLLYAVSKPEEISGFSLPMFDLLVEPMVIAAFLFPICALKGFWSRPV